MPSHRSRRSIALATPLQHLEVLILDCQTTGANPHRGHLLEVAWSRFRAIDSSSDTMPIEVRLVRLPDGQQVPRRIETLTGIGDADLETASTPEEVWRQVRAAAYGLSDTHDLAPAVAHFARFERTFLEALHREHGGDGAFPLRLICTHEIARRLLPGLPRRGLRAVAGYLGHIVPEAKRAAPHVAATAVVWAELTARLARAHGVDSLDALYDWLRTVSPARTGGREFLVDRELRLALPDAPGIYRMQARGGEVLYLGKASSLKQRVNSYFQKRRHGAERTAEMLTQTHRIEVTETATPLEAALLESDEIKRLAPPYNVALRQPQSAVWFASTDLSSLASEPDRHHRRGPAPRAEPLAALGSLRALLYAPDPDIEIGRSLFGLPDDAALDGECLGAGIQRFCSSYGVANPTAVSTQHLLQLGARLWHERMQTRMTEQQDAAEEPAFELIAEPIPSEQPAAEPWVPSRPESIQSLLEAALLRGAHLLRRGIWLCRLSESVLDWQPRRRAAEESHRRLVIERAGVAAAEDVPPDATMPVPPGCERTHTQRQSSFDAVAYDRLRVLTTEIRALLAANHPVVVRLGPGRTLDAGVLRRWLYWV